MEQQEVLPTPKPLPPEAGSTQNTIGVFLFVNAQSKVYLPLFLTTDPSEGVLLLWETSLFFQAGGQEIIHEHVSTPQPESSAGAWWIQTAKAVPKNLYLQMRATTKPSHSPINPTERCMFHSQHCPSWILPSAEQGYTRQFNRTLHCLISKVFTKNLGMKLLLLG